jgi:hypothetical protein
MNTTILIRKMFTKAFNNRSKSPRREHFLNKNEVHILSQATLKNHLQVEKRGFARFYKQNGYSPHERLYNRNARLR